MFSRLAASGSRRTMGNTRRGRPARGKERPKTNRKLFLEQFENRIVLASTLHAIAAANIDVIQHDTDNNTTSVTVTAPYAFNDFRIRAGSNRGDYNIQIGDISVDDAVLGIVMTSVSENGRDNGPNNGAAGNPAGVYFATSAIEANASNQFYIPIFQAPSGLEWNVNVSAAYFTYDTWYAGYARNSAGTNGGANNTFVGHADLALGTHFVDLGSGRSTLDLREFNINSQTDGVLLVTHAKNEDNFALSRANEDGTWTIFIKDNQTSGTSTEQDPVSFVYIPKSDITIVSGKFRGDGSISMQNRDFQVQHVSEGTYRLTIPGYTPNDGVLIISPDADGVKNFDNIVNFKADGNGWIIESRTLPGSAVWTAPVTLESPDPNEHVASFVFIPGPKDAGITVAPTSGLFTTENGGTDAFSIVLNRQPAADVTIALSSSDVTEGTVSPASITFTQTNWWVPQVVTVTGVDDEEIDGNVAYTIITAPAVSADPNFNGINPADVTAVNIDNDQVGIIVWPTAGLQTTEAGGQATFVMLLNSQPTADVTVPLSSSDESEGTVSPTSLTFTPQNWNIPQTVTVTGVDDGFDDGDVVYYIITGAAISDDPVFHGLNTNDVEVTNIDDDTAGFLISPVSGLVTTEMGGTASFAIVLASVPEQDVTIGLTSSNTAEGTVDIDSVTFTAANWNVVRTITITGVDDLVGDGDRSYVIVTSVTTADPVYGTLDAADVSVTNLDNEPRIVLPLGDVRYGVGDPAIGIDGTAILTDLDTTHYAAGSLTVAVTANATGSDLLEIRNVGTGPGQIGVSEGVVTYEGVAIGTVTGGDGLNPLVVTFNSQASVMAVQALLRAVTFRNVSATPSLTARTVTFSIEDGLGGTSNLASKDVHFDFVRTFAYRQGVDSGFGVYTGAADIQLDQSFPDTPTPRGQDAQGLLVDWPDAGGTNEDQVLLRFADIFGNQPGQIPLGATIVSATLTVQTNNPGHGARMHRMLLPWDAENDTWNSFGSGQNGRNSTPGAQADNIEARSAWDSQIGMFTGAGTTGSGVTIMGVTNDIQAWANGATNNGWLMRGWQDRTDGWAFSPSEAENPEHRPMLTVQWLPPNSATSTRFRQDLDGYFGAYDTLLVQQAPDDDQSTNPILFVDAPDVGGANESQVLLKFENIIGDGQGQIPPGSQIHAAALVLASTTSNAMGHGGQFFAMKQSWSEWSANWNSFGGNGVQPNGVEAATVSNAQAGTAALSPLVQASYNSFDVTTDVQNWVRGTMANQGWAILPWAGGTDGWGFSSSDAVEEERPELRVFYTPPGITVSPTSGLFTSEYGDSAQFTIVLNTAPTADVTIGLVSGDPTEGTVSPAAVTFTPANWNIPQVVTVTGVDDNLEDGNVEFLIYTDPAVSSDPAYNGLDADDVSVINLDNDSPGIFIAPTSGLVTTEAGGTATFTVNLQTRPSANVTIGLSSSDVTEGTVSPSELVFNEDNWFVPQTVTITGVDDFIIDGDVAYTIITAPAVSDDPLYSGLDSENVSVINLDNDVAGVTIVPTSGLITTEAGGSDTFTIVLNTQPSSNITINMTSSDPTEGTVSPTSVTFTPANWNVPQTVTVTGVDDNDDDNDVEYFIITQPINTGIFGDKDYNGLNPPDVQVTNIDNENVPPVVILPTGDIFYRTGTTGVGIDARATVTDTDPSSYAGATLTVTIAANASSDDRLFIRNDGTGEGQVGVSGSNVTLGGIVVATFTGGQGAAPLVVTFNSNASATTVQAVLRVVSFSNVSANPDTAPRSLAVVVNDGLPGGVSATATKTVRVGVKQVAAFQEGVDWGYGTYVGAADIQLAQVTPNTPYPIGNDSGGLLVDWDAGVVNAQVLLRFDNLIGDGAGQIPLGSQIISARLVVSTGNTGDGAKMHRMLIPWDSELETWNSFGSGGDRNTTPGIQADGIEARAAWDSQVGTAFGGQATGTGTTIIGVTGDIQAWANGETNYGWGMIGWTDHADGWAFRASESANPDVRPLLVVEWVPGDTPSAGFRQGVNGYTGAADTRIYETAPDTDYSRTATLWTDWRDASNLDSQFLLRFDDIIGNGVNQIPPGSTVHAAVLTLASTANNAQGAGGSFHKMLSPWSDTDTWNTLVGGVSVDDVQASSTYNTQAGGPSLQPYVQAGFNPLDVTVDVQAWVNGQANYGWAAMPWVGGVDGWGVQSSEVATISHRPELRVFFTAGPGVAVNPIKGLTATEGGVTAEYTVVLNTVPTDDVTVTITGDSQVEVSVDGGANFSSEATLTFTVENAKSARTVVIRAIDDAVLEGNHTGTVSMVASSADPKYDGVSIQDLVVAITDNETVQVEQVVINDGSNQRSMVTEVSVRFNADVAIAAGAFQLVNRETSAVVDLSITTSLVNGQTVAVLRFLEGASVQTRAAGNSLVDGNYELTIDASKVTFNGLKLDGDGQGGDYVFGEEAVDNFFRLYGDVTGLDRLVGVPDFNAFRSAFGKASGDALYRGELDFDGDGIIGVGDFNQFRARFGKSLGF